MTLSINVLPSIPSLRSAQAETKGAKQASKQPPTTHPRSSPSVVSSVSKAVDSLLYFKDGLTHRQREERRSREERRQVLLARMHNAEFCSQWDAAAQELDVLEGNEKWKEDISTGDYNPEILAARLKDLDDARASGDMRTMMHLVRTALSRDLGGMGNIDLYRHSYCGTKKLIERYVDSALQTISTLVDRSAPHAHIPDDDEFEARDLLDAMLYARQSFGRSALLLSGGGTFGMTHIGVLKALYEAKLLPRIISGASAGSIVCAVFCAKTDDELPQVIEEFPHGDLAVFEEQGNEEGLLEHLRRLLTEGNWSDIKHLTRVMRDLLGDITFQEAYNRTRRICNICVSTASVYELPRLLNYVTAPNVMIWSAVAASCSVPVVFSAGALLVKNPMTGEHSPWNPTPQVWIDGSVDNDLPMTRLSEMFNVNHFIVSQVNPHVVPFLAKDDAPCPSTNNHHSVIYKDDHDWLHTMTSLAKTEALHRMQFMAEIGVFPNLVSKLRSILSQKYSGDINILPAIGVFDLPRILKNPTAEFMTRSCLLGERATWPKLARIWDRCAIELALDRAVHALRARVVFSKSQVDLRRMATGSLATAHKGSHEPLAVPTQTESIYAKEKLKHRHRRSSGSSLVNPYHRSSAYESSYNVMDTDSDDNEQLEITMRHPRRKPNLKLKKFPKHHALLNGPLTGPAIPSNSETESFDFSRPLTPPTRPISERMPPSPKRHVAISVYPPSPVTAADSAPDADDKSHADPDSSDSVSLLSDPRNDEERIERLATTPEAFSSHCFFLAHTGGGPVHNGTFGKY
ncbi:putative NTE family protein [Rosellinia necatrix]|uniref:Patatin-like phospholipase domain-containing protein n=1 Tax=Rosellinia necatrix TaxID=77044 RepID=A0A1W2TIV1_ROSNE|nr:putative NTE family protein [Rosellinia necatrix]